MKKWKEKTFQYQQWNDLIKMLISSVSIFAPFLFTVNSNLIVEYMKNSVKDHFCSLNKVVLCENLKSNPYRYLLTTSEGTYVEALLYCVFERELCIPSWIEIHTMWAPLLLRLDLECMSKTKKAFNLISGSFLRRQLMIANYHVKKFVRKSQQSKQTLLIGSYFLLMIFKK